MSDFVLYNYFRSSTSYRARIALNLKSINYDYKAIHLLNNGGEQHSPEYRKINPMGGVPTLVHAGKTISQSRAIIEYLDNIKPEPPLYPKSAFEKAKVNQIIDNINCEMHPFANLRVTQYLEKNLKVTEEQKEKWIHHWLHEGFNACEKILENTSGQFCFGDEITAADVFLVPQIFTAKRFKTDLGRYPTLQRINEECVKLVQFQQAHPLNQPDTPQDLK